MPKLANERHELYAMHRAKGMVPAMASKASGFASGSSIYSTLEQDAAIIQRIAELMEELKDRKAERRAAAQEAAKVVGQTVGNSRLWVLEMLAENAAMARDEGDFKESNEALRMIGEELGMFEGGSDPDSPDGKIPNRINVDDMHALTSKLAKMRELPPPEPPDSLERALKIIGNNRVPAQEREISIGSEVDVALDGSSVVDPNPFEGGSTTDHPVP